MPMGNAWERKPSCLRLARCLLSDYIDLREDLYPMDPEVESDLLMIEAKANWQECQDKLLEAEMWLSIAIIHLMAALGKSMSARWWLWAHERRN